jgi:transposase
MNTITQDTKYKQSIMAYVSKHGVSKASRKYNKTRSYIYYWLKRYDGTIESLNARSRRPHSHPGQHSPEELKLIRDMRKRNPELGIVEFWCRLRERRYKRSLCGLFRVMRHMGYFFNKKPKKKYIPKPYEQMDYPGQRVQIDVKHVPKACRVGAVQNQKLYQFTAIDEYSRLRYLEAFDEASTFSSTQFAQHAIEFYASKGIQVECIQTDNGMEFTNRFAPMKSDKPTLFETSLQFAGIRHKLIRPYTPRHNGKVERSHREDQKRFYNVRTFYTLEDFAKQLKVHMARSNNIPMRPLNYRSPINFLFNPGVQYV